MGPDTNPYDTTEGDFSIPVFFGRSARKTAHGPTRDDARPEHAKVRRRTADAEHVQAASAAPDVTWYRIRLGEVLALRDVPPLLEEVRRAAAIGARVVELDASAVVRLTEGARCVLEAAQRRLAEYQIELRFSVG